MENLRFIEKPTPDEYPEYSAIYFDCIDMDCNILEFLSTSIDDIERLLLPIEEELLLYRYKPGKWTIKEILLHLIDDERIFAYRALRYARGDNQPLHGFDQDAYASVSGANTRTLDDLIWEYRTVREATLSLFQNLPEESFLLGGKGIDFDGEAINFRTVRALAFHIAGHEQRHIKIIKKRYLQDRSQ